MKLTPEQSELLAAAVENSGAVLITAIGSPNDILWGELSDAGYMEAADLPDALKGCSLNAWQLSEAGRTALKEQEQGR